MTFPVCVIVIVSVIVQAQKSASKWSTHHVGCEAWGRQAGLRCHLMKYRTSLKIDRRRAKVWKLSGTAPVKGLSNGNGVQLYVWSAGRGNKVTASRTADASMRLSRRRRTRFGSASGPNRGSLLWMRSTGALLKIVRDQSFAAALCRGQLEEMKGKSEFARLTEAELSTLVRMVGKDGTLGDDKLWFNVRMISTRALWTGGSLKMIVRPTAAEESKVE